MQPGDIKAFLVLYFAIPGLPLALLDQRRAAGYVLIIELVLLPFIVYAWRRCVRQRHR